MSSIQDILTHMEFGGYKVEARENKYFATHGQHLNIFFKEFRGGILFTAYFGASPHAKSHLNEFKCLVNDLNRLMAAARSYVDDDGDFLMEGYYPLPYTRSSFAAYLDALHADQSTLFKFDGLHGFLE